MIKYLGSKRALLGLITDTIAQAAPGGSVLDLFSGTSRVGHALKRRGHRVIANDHNAYAHVLARCYVAADLDDLREAAESLVKEFNRLPGEPGYFTKTFCEQSRFFQPKNGARVDAIREAISLKSLPPDLEAVMLVSLMEAADRVDSTTGVQMAYLKQWAPRASNDLELRVPDMLPRPAGGKCAALNLDAAEAARCSPVDLAYIDPPYNQHSYLGNYHIWESLVRWDKPEVYGVACKRVDCRDRQSVFNSRPRFRAALAEMLAAIRAPVIVVSFSNEGYLDRAEMEQLLGGLFAGRSHVTTIETDHKRYVGAQIGIHNPQGEKVGTVSHLRNKEYLYVVSESPLATRLVGLSNR
ncbi:MAG: DNA adenine methylase [Planctomycetia bacterium]|nr:DNA adenine methylase [Planctomycetia bacterium]